ncbi:hypothetical protein GGX14DRAFT_484842 [Mycena pura]|uniref:Aminoglycoside phosphotransferase domain-containing protein n=1 Tax=Mycena pura TaxID=153505 RepID=A0AAD6UL10_9AGAR|nr:hypothetical protein GGX14DRAFT_484842 [Mycena pura]
MVLSACDMTCSPHDVTVLREGTDMGRQTVFNIANTWIIRIFELYDGYRQPASFISSVLTALERAGLPCEHIRYHGVVPGTSFHYTVTKFVEGIPLTDELCCHPDVRLQIGALYRALRLLEVPDTVGTVEDYMRPRLLVLHEKLSTVSPAVLDKVGELASLADFKGYQMVTSHCDLAPENIIARFEPSVSVSVIDWEFCAYVPEFRIELQLGSKVACKTWGAGFVHDLGYGPYPEKVVWTESLCCVAEDYEGPDFEQNVLVALSARL